MTLYPGMATTTVDVDGAAVRYHDSDPRDTSTEPVVLVHGTGGSTGTSFWALYPMLAMKRRTIGIDLVPPPGREPAQVSAFARQVGAVLDALDSPRPVHLAGYSLGAVVATAVAARNGHRLHSLTLIAGWIRTDLHQRLRHSVWRTLHDERPAALRDFALFTAYSPSFLRNITDQQYEEILARRAGRRDARKEMELNSRIDIADEAAAVDVPTLVIGCAQDYMVPVHHSRELFGAIEDSRLIEIDSGHGVVDERPAQLFELIENFCSAPRAHGPGALLHESDV